MVRINATLWKVAQYLNAKRDKERKGFAKEIPSHLCEPLQISTLFAFKFYTIRFY